MKYVRAGGNRALNKNGIYSGHADKTLTVDIYSVQTNYHDIYCYEGDTCYINCCEEEACDRLNLYCYGDCIIDCTCGGTLPFNNSNGDYSCVYQIDSAAPSAAPSRVPSQAPSAAPSRVPTDVPSRVPTGAPSLAPTRVPSEAPSRVPTNAPTITPSNSPSQPPTQAPSNTPSQPPTRVPSEAPTQAPSGSPSQPPTRVPTNAPFDNPTTAPTLAPTLAPSQVPTRVPSDAPSIAPTAAPTFEPTFAPTDPPTQCHDEFQCAYLIVDSVFTNETDIECYGGYSCYGAKKIEAIDRTIECGGAYSCYNAINVTMKNVAYTGSSQLQLECSGLFSCANVQLLYNDMGSIKCQGERSCESAYIFHNQTTKAIVCNGDRSCLNATLLGQASSNFYFKGNLAGYGATMTTIGTDTTTYRFQGADSGKDALVICNPGQECKINCWGDACIDLKIKCSDGTIGGNDGSCTFTFDCTYAEYHETYCPDGYETEYEDLPKLASVTLSTLENSGYYFYDGYDGINSINVCNDTNSYIYSIEDNNDTLIYGNINCGDYQECNYDKLITKLGNICCTSQSGCQNTDGIEGNNITRCDGGYSCGYNDIGNGIYNPSGYETSYSGTELYINYNIYVTGKNSAIESIIGSNSDNDFYESYDIICTGHYACQSATIQYADEVYCNGHYGCRQSSITRVDRVYAYGMNGANGAEISKVAQNVYCASLQSCINAKITDVTGNIYATSWRSLYNGRINGVGTAVVCQGYESCWNTTMKNVYTKVEIEGYNTIGSSLIILSENFATVNVRGEHPDSWTVRCESNSIDNIECNINCESEFACQNLNLECYDDCNLDCDDSFQCPTFLVGEDSSSTLISGICDCEDATISEATIIIVSICCTAIIIAVLAAIVYKWRMKFVESIDMEQQTSIQTVQLQSSNQLVENNAAGNMSIQLDTGDAI